MVERQVSAQRPRALELLHARGGDDRPRSEGACELERCDRDAAADTPDQHPLSLREACLGHEHPVRGLEDERKSSPLLERKGVVEHVQLRGRQRLELAVRAVGVLSDDRDTAVVSDAGIEDDAVPDSEALDAFAQRSDDAGSVCAEDPGLGNRGQPLPHPHVQVVQCRRT